MSTIYVIAEGPTDVELLRLLVLPELVGRVRIYSAGGKSSIPSYARSVLDLRQRLVAVVMDADSTQSEAILSQKREVEELLRMQSLTIPFTVVMAVPSIESVLFAAPGLLERVYDKPLSSDLLDRAKQDPKRALYELEQGPGVGSANHRIELCATCAVEECIKQADAGDITEMRKHPVARELNDFLARVTADQMQPA